MERGGACEGGPGAGRRRGRAEGEDSEAECLGREGERAGLNAEQGSEPRSLESPLDLVFVKVYLFLPIPTNLPRLLEML